MKRSIYFAALLLAGAVSFQSCTKDQCQETFIYYEQVPVYMSMNEIQTDIQNEAPQALVRPGGLYFYNDLVLINESFKGIHILDNSNPSNPVPLSFIPIPCNGDMAVRGNILYVDNCTDLLAIDISDPLAVELLSRNENVFTDNIWFDESQGKYLVYYDLVKREVIQDCQTPPPTTNMFWGFRNVDVLAETAFDDQIGGGDVGVGGSMARFTLAKDHLYMVSDFNLKVFNLDNPLQPAETSTINLGWGIETIIPHGNELFIGSNSGMFIFDNTDPANPVELSRLAHATACDPVFVKDNFAYVTLREGSFCQGFDNQLDLIDISDLRNPVLVKSFSMDNPHGLSIDENDLFLCEGRHGLKVFDITNPEKLNNNRLDWVKDLHAYDVIVLPGDKKVAMVIGEDGFYQYNFDNPENLKLLSKIEVQSE
ncbi:MAG: hypothetical protein KDC44_01965 [Phaeodactylibacter sp.]|nr:hypothetical protein [Phaeodactylibacter sp.]